MREMYAIDKIRAERKENIFCRFINMISSPILIVDYCHELRGTIAQRLYHISQISYSF